MGHPGDRKHTRARQFASERPRSTRTHALTRISLTLGDVSLTHSLNQSIRLALGRTYDYLMIVPTSHQIEPINQPSNQPINQSIPLPTKGSSTFRSIMAARRFRGSALVFWWRARGVVTLREWLLDEREGDDSRWL